MIENDAITEIKNELCAIHPFGERFAQSLFFEEKLADALDARLEGFEKLQKQLSAFVDATLLLDSSDLSTSQRLALYMSRDFQAATAMAGSFFGPKLKQYSALKRLTSLFRSDVTRVWSIILNTSTLPHIEISVNACYAFCGSDK